MLGNEVVYFVKHCRADDADWSVMAMTWLGGSLSLTATD